MDKESKIVFLIPNRSESLPKNGCEKNWAQNSLKIKSYKLILYDIVYISKPFPMPQTDPIQTISLFKKCVPKAGTTNETASKSKNANNLNIIFVYINYILEVLE